MSNLHLKLIPKTIHPDQQFADRDIGQPPVQSGPRAPAFSDDAGADFPSYGQATGGSDMDPARTWDPQADVNPPSDAGARLFVPSRFKVPSSVPVRLPKLEPPADLIYTHTELIGDLSSSLAYPAHSVIVDNYSNQWLWFPAARRWTPPYTFGIILPLLQATEVAEYRLQVPPTFTQGAPHATQYIVTTWCAALLPAAPGTGVPGGIA